MKVKDKVVIVTGAGSGIGKATAIHFANQKAIVVVSDIKMKRAKEVAEAINENGGKAFANRTNVADFIEVKRLVANTVEKLGKLDIIVLALRHNEYVKYGSNKILKKLKSNGIFADLKSVFNEQKIKRLNYNYFCL